MIKTNKLINFILTLLVFVNFPAYAVNKFDDNYIQLAKELSKVKIPRPTVKSFDEARDIVKIGEINT